MGRVKEALYQERYICDYWKCEWTGTLAEALSGPDPFNVGDTLYACPHCRDMTLVRACDMDGCNHEATCGTPTPTGYRTTCHTHMPKVETNEVPQKTR